MKYKVGDKCRVLPINGCGAWCRLNGDYIVIKSISMAGYSYDIYDKNNKCIGECFECLKDEDLAPYERTLDNLEVGDVLVRHDSEHTVLGICGRVIFISASNQPDKCSDSGYTIQELKNLSFKIKPQESQEPNIVEMTLEEVAKLKGVPVENLRIKE